MKFVIFRVWLLWPSEGIEAKIKFITWISRLKSIFLKVLFHSYNQKSQKIEAYVIFNPIVPTTPDILEQAYPEVFPTCAMTQATAKIFQLDNKEIVDRNETFMCGSVLTSTLDVSNLKSSLDVLFPREQLIPEQRKDFCSLLDQVVDKNEVHDLSAGYFMRAGV